MMAIWCASASIVFGIIFGEFLGNLGEITGVIPLKIGGIQILPIWHSRHHVINELLQLTIIIGFCHVVLGLLLGIIESARMRNKHHMWENIGLMLGLLGLVLFFLPIDEGIIPTSSLHVTAGAMLVVGIFLLIRHIGPAGPIEIISLVANILSYCRLMALGIAGMFLANVANSLAGKQESLVLGIIVALPMHLVAVALGIIGPTIHALRLHFVEFLPKFYIGDGRDYSPLQRKDHINEK
jgi:V/A-type H+-transporting ATPase subunit I